MVPPVRVKTPQGPTLLRASEFWTADEMKPAPPPMRAPLMADLTESFWWKGCSSSTLGMGCGFAMFATWMGGGLLEDSEGRRWTGLDECKKDDVALAAAPVGWLGQLRSKLWGDPDWPETGQPKITQQWF